MEEVYLVRKDPRLSLMKGISKDKYLNFHSLWLRYKRNIKLTSETSIREQILYNCSSELSENLENLFGNQLDDWTKGANSC